MKIPTSSQIRCGLLTLSLALLSYVAPADTVQVHVGQGATLSFTPDPVNIQAGDTVEWIWDDNGHSVTSGTPGNPDGIFDSGIQGIPFTFSHTFPSAASFPYYCTRHQAMMVGTVNVQAAGVSIAGTLLYCSNPVPGPVPNATLTLTGSASGSTLSDASGAYTFSALTSGGTYTVTPSKSARVPGSPNINTVDVIATQRHFLNLGTPLAGCRLTAADVNGDTNVNTVDVIAIQRFFLGLSTGIANVGKYKFTPASRTYTGLVSNQTGQNYDTLVFGDTAAGFVELVE